MARKKMEVGGRAWIDQDDLSLNLNPDSLKHKRRLELSTESIELVTTKNNINEDWIGGDEYTEQLRKVHRAINKEVHEWVDETRQNTEANDISDSDDFENAISGTTFRFKSKVKRLLPHKISTTRLPDVNRNSVSKCAIRAMDFHPDQPVIITGGADHTLRLFNYGTKSQANSTRFYLPKFVIFDAKFNLYGDKIYLLSQNKQMGICDTSEGRIWKQSDLKGASAKAYTKITFPTQKQQSSMFGLTTIGSDVLLCDERSNSVVHTFSMSTQAVNGMFSPNPFQFITAEEAGHVYVWDTRNGRCSMRFHDESSLSLSSMGCTYNNNSRWLLINGSSQGYVNMFDLNEEKTKQPIKTLSNLKSKVDNISVHNSGDLISVASAHKNNAIRLIHTPTLTVYQNFPSNNMDFGRISAVSFSKKKCHLAVGTGSGRIMFFRINDATRSLYAS